MLQRILQSYLPYFRLFLAALILFTASRIVFGLQNPETFPPAGKTVPAFLYGIRYDITAFAWIFLPLTLIFAFPLEIASTAKGKSIIRFLFIFLTASALLANYADTGWFAFQRKRSTADVFKVLATGDDFLANLPSYLLSHIHLLFCWLISVFLLLRFSSKILNKNNSVVLTIHEKITGTILFIGVSVIAIRGGVQLKPLSTQNAAIVNGPVSAPLILNTPYTLIKSAGETALPESEYFSKQETENLWPVEHYMQNADSVQHNIVIIILESFSSEYTGKQFTPFLDSLSGQSISFSNAYANAKRSIEGLPAILASLPALMNEPFITSQYNTIRLSSIASMLKPAGYTTSFFHGGKNGTMGFDNFTAAAGFGKYYGKSEYDGPASDNDGHWGIYDHAFYSFMIRTLNKQYEPFASAVFSLSSHHPYTVPAGLTQKYPDGPVPILKSIAYADDALRSFFNEAAKSPWYQNTVFIITADHTGPAYTETGGTETGIFHVPLLIYYQGITPAARKDIAQQIDILPTALHFSGYKGKYFSLGRDLVDSSNKKGYAINYNSGNWQLISSENIIRWDGENEPVCNDENKSQCNTSFNILKAGLQQYRQRLINNTFAAE